MKRADALVTLAALAALLTLAADAHARQFQMNGTWAMRRGANFWPLQFAQSKMGSQLTHTSAGLLSKALFTPNGPVLGVGAVSVTGSGPATLRIPPGRFGGSFSAGLPFPSAPVLVQLTSALDAAGPAAAATLAPEGGPGSFTWCVGNPACVDAPGTMDPPTFGYGRIIYRAGANRFGGVMQMLLQGHGSFGVTIDSNAFQVLHVPRAPTDALDSGIQHTGGSYANVVMDYLAHAVATQPLAAPTPSGLITAPGPRVTTMFGVTTAPGLPYPTLRLPTLATTPMGMKASQVLVHTGFPWTTGTVIVQQTLGSNGDDFFTVMGSDLRTALGAGNIALVAGGITQRYDTAGRSSYGSFGVVRMSLSPPVPSLSPAGAAVAALLVLLAVGYALRPRR